MARRLRHTNGSAISYILHFAIVCSVCNLSVIYEVERDKKKAKALNGTGMRQTIAIEIKGIAKANVGQC